MAEAEITFHICQPQRFASQLVHVWIWANKCPVGEAGAVQWTMTSRSQHIGYDQIETDASAHEPVFGPKGSPAETEALCVCVCVCVWLGGGCVPKMQVPSSVRHSAVLPASPRIASPPLSHSSANTTTVTRCQTLRTKPRVQMSTWATRTAVSCVDHRHHQVCPCAEGQQRGACSCCLPAAAGVCACVRCPLSPVAACHTVRLPSAAQCPPHTSPPLSKPGSGLGQQPPRSRK